MPKPMRNKIHHLWITSNYHFTKHIHLFSNQKLFGCYTLMIIYIQNSCVFWCRTPKHFHELSSMKLCLTTNTRSFTRGGIYPCLLLPDISFLYHFIQSRDFVRRCPTGPSPLNQSPNAVLIITMHSHPFNALSLRIFNAMQCTIACYITPHV